MYLSSKSLIHSKHIRASAWREHAPFVFWLMDVLKPQKVVELGTHNGFSFLSLCQAAKAIGLPTEIYAVDTWQGDEHAGFYSTEIFDALEMELRNQYPGIGVMIRSTFADARPQFEDGSVDLLHIDGRHRYEDVLEDFEIWKSTLSDRGVALFHDTRVQQGDFGVWKFWQELEKQYPTFEFFHGNGLGVLIAGNNAPSTLLELCAESFEKKSFVREAYERLGHTNTVHLELSSVAQQLSDKVAERNQIAQELSDKSQALDACKNNIEELKSQLEAAALERDNGRHERASLRDQIEAAVTERNELGAHLQRQQEINNALTASTSWRLTAPYRRVGHQVKRVRHVSRALPAIVRRGGGLKAATTTALRILRHEGFSGLKQKWIRANNPGHIIRTPPDTTILSLENGNYSLRKNGSEYLYIPPSKPYDLDKNLNSMEAKPFFSIIVPAYNTPRELMGKLIESVQSQWYSHWELVIVDDASPQSHCRELLDELMDSRIKVHWSQTNKGIAGATNTGIDLSAGDYIVLLDHDDELTVDCLYELALCINKTGADYIYSDEDKIDPEGRYGTPHFKPDWSPDTMMSTMYVCHVSCIKRDLIADVGGLRSEYNGCQDWDLVLRVTEKTSKIAHIPKVLYHWRIIPGSVSGALSEKPYVVDASKRVREDALRRRGLNGTLEPVAELPGYFSVRYELSRSPLVSIIIPTRDNADVLKCCIDSILAISTYKPIEIVIINNGSIKEDTKAYFNELKEVDCVRIIDSDTPFNFSYLCNLGAAHSSGEFLLFLNDDTEVITQDFLTRMLGYAALKHIGAVGAKLLYSQYDEIQHSGILNLDSGPQHAFLRLPSATPGYFARNILEYNWIAVTGACMLIEKEKFIKVGGFSEDMPVAYNDIDICFRLIDAGYFNIVCQRAKLYHHESVSRGLDQMAPEKKKRLRDDMFRLYEKNPKYYRHDPFYNINLHPNGIYFDYAR